MNRSVLVTSLVVIALAGCSRQSADTTKPGQNPPVNNTAQANGNTQVMVPQPAPADANQITSTDPLRPELQKKLVNSATGAAPMQTGRPAPDDSTFTSTLSDVGRETRTFHKHPQLLKVEKVIEVSKQSIKVYLRNGKVIDLPGEKIPNLSTIPASDILRIAGISSPSAPPSTGSEGEKRAKQ